MYRQFKSIDYTCLFSTYETAWNLFTLIIFAVFPSQEKIRLFPLTTFKNLYVFVAISFCPEHNWFSQNRRFLKCDQGYSINNKSKHMCSSYTLKLSQLVQIIAPPVFCLYFLGRCGCEAELICKNTDGFLSCQQYQRVFDQGRTRPYKIIGLSMAFRVLVLLRLIVVLFLFFQVFTTSGNTSVNSVIPSNLDVNLLGNFMFIWTCNDNRSSVNISIIMQF